jgi:hypothetical protein
MRLDVKAIQATAIVMVMVTVMVISPSIFGCPAGRSLGGRKSKSRIGFPTVGS